jgi:hypothetical protein
MADRSADVMWFDPRGSIVLRIYTFLLILFAGNVYMYVWCELFTPRWYDGPLRNRYGVLISNGDNSVLGLPLEDAF